jgi:hypothetical protein
MKTTLDLNDQLLADAKALAAQQRTSLTRLIEEGLQLRLRAKAASVSRGKEVRLPVFKGRGGLVAGVNALSNKALLKAAGDDAIRMSATVKSGSRRRCDRQNQRSRKTGRLSQKRMSVQTEGSTVSLYTP